MATKKKRHTKKLNPLCLITAPLSVAKKIRDHFLNDTRVAVIRLEGIIRSGGTIKQGLSLEAVEEMLEKAFTSKRIVAVALQLNSPGGAPAQTELIYRRIRQLAEKEQKPVWVFIEDVAASGGYWIACAGDEIYALDTSIVGSIGVISSGFGFVKAIEKLGVERRVYTEGSQKGMLDPFQPENPKDIALLKTLQNDLYERFKHAVTSRRTIKESDLEEVTSGAFWTGERAKNFGLIDKIGTMHEVLTEKYGEDLTLVTLEPHRSVFKRIFANNALDQLPSNAIQALEERGWWARYGI